MLFSSQFSAFASADEPLSALLVPDTEKNLDRSAEISYSGDGNLLAVSYGEEVYFYHTMSRNELDVQSPKSMNDYVTSVEFTSDSSNTGNGYLLIGRESVQTNTPAISVYDLSTTDSNGNWMQLGHVEDGIEVKLIITIIDGDKESFAYATELANGKQYIIEHSFSDLNEPIKKIETGHDTRITCLDYDSENNVFISGSDGRVEINIETGHAVQEHLEPGRSIFDCKFGKGGIYAWSSEEGVKIRDSDHSFLQSLTLPSLVNAQKIFFDPILDEMKLLTNEAGNSLVTYSTIGNWNIIDIMLIGHVVFDIDISPSTGEIATSTHSKYITLYSDDWMDPNVEQSPSNDLDHDGIDDANDADRDGDGIRNELDVLCESTTPCNLVADTDYIRNVEINIEGENLVIKEKVHFSIETSQGLRLLAAESVDEDGYIEPEERTLFNNAFCSSLDSDLVINSWYGIVTFDNNSLIAGSDANILFDCDGLENLDHDSSSERVSFSWTISFELAHEVSSNYTVSIKPPPPLGYGMPVNLVHDYPINLKVTDINIKTYKIDYWFDTTASFELEFIGEEDDGIEITEWAKYIEYSSYVLFSIAFLVFSGLMVLRYKNRFNVDEFTSKKKSPPPSKRNLKDYDYYNPGKREDEKWNYGDDGEYYYSETYTDYKKASDSVKKSKVRKVKVETKKVKVAEKSNRRRIVRKKNEKMDEGVETASEEIEDVDINEAINKTVVNESPKPEAVLEKLDEELEDKSNEDEDQIMDDALSKFFS